MNAFIRLSLPLSLLVLVTAKKYCPSSEEKPKYYEDTLKSKYGAVVFSSLVFRSGNRNELLTFPTDPYKEYFTERGLAELTNAGKRRSYRLGIWARARYANLLKGKSCTPYLLNATSGIRDQAVNSAELFLAGFCPPVLKSEKWSNRLGSVWQPIPVHTIPQYEDNMLYLTAYCARYNLELALYAKSEEIARVFKKYNSTFNYIRQYSQLNISRDNGVLAAVLSYALCDDLFVEADLGLEQPSWAKKIYPQPCNEISSVVFKFLVINNITKRLKAGPLLKSIIDDMVKKRNNATEYPKVFQIYSAFDTTIAVLLDSLDVFDGTVPPYSSTVLVELRNKNGDYIVTISYRKYEDRPPILLDLPSCRNPCTLDKFIAATRYLIPDNWQNECLYFTPDYNTYIFA